MKGRANIATGLLFLVGFMVYGFFLIYLRDFAPGKEQWIADYAVGKHFDSRLADGHGNLFVLINTAVGLVLMRVPVQQSSARWIAGLALAGTLIPLGILSEVVHGVPPLASRATAPLTRVSSWKAMSEAGSAHCGGPALARVPTAFGHDAQVPGVRTSRSRLR